MTPGCPPRVLSLRLVLVIPFIVQIVVAVSLVGYLSYRNSQKAIADLATQLAGEVAQRVEEQLTTYLSQPQLVNQLNLDGIYLGYLEVNNRQALQKHFWKQLQRFEGLALISLVSTDNEMFMVSRFNDRLQADLVLRSRPNTIQTFALDAQGNLSTLQSITPNFDPQNTPPGYRNALKAGKPVWNPIFSLTGLPYLSISASAPAIAPDGTLQGVVFADVTLDFVDRYLQQLEVGQSGQVFIIERSGELVASSALQASFTQDATGKGQRILASQSANPILSAAVRHIEQHLGGISAITETQQTPLTLNHQRYLLQLIPFRDKYGLDWVVGVLVAEADFMAEIEANNRRTILLCLGALAIAATLGFLTARHITYPLWQLSQSAENLSQGQLDQPIPTGSITEITTLANAFNRMAIQLKSAFSELEQKVQERTTELSTALSQLKQTQAQLIHSEKMSSLGQLVAGIAHEINNPISFIHGNISPTRDYVNELLELLGAYEHHFPEPPPEISQLSEQLDLDFLRTDLLKSILSMEVGTERVRNIVLSLRGFAHLDEADLKEIDLHEGIEHTLAVLGSRLATVQVIREYSSLEPVICYPGQLNQVFLNIITNALDALEQQKENSQPCLTIRTRQLNPDWVRIEIADNGPGISETDQSRIFDAFFTTKPVGKGTGLGLYSSSQIIMQQHRGMLFYVPEPLGGSRFVIEIPTR